VRGKIRAIGKIESRKHQEAEKKAKKRGHIGSPALPWQHFAF
jgi:hypothetical protein